MRKVNELRQQTVELERDYLEALILFRAAPTILGLKPATLLSFTPNRFNLKTLWKQYKNCFGRYWGKVFNLKWLCIKETPTGSLVLFYRPDLIEATINRTENQIFLKNYGYHNLRTAAEYFKVLIERFRNEQFPHEVGIFLGVPAADVWQFIENRGKGYTINGYWKVYSDPESALKIFDKFQKSQSEMLQFIRLYYNEGVGDLLNCSR